MKIIYLLILSLFISFNAYAVDIYKCKIDKMTEIASCGFFNTCIDTKTNKKYTDPFVHSYDYKSSYTVLTFEDKLIVKRDFDKYEFVYERSKKDYRFFIHNDEIRVFTPRGSFLLFKKHFYHEIETNPAKMIVSGKCEKE